MSNEFEIHAQVRSDMGKGASRRLRHAGQVPAVLYGGEGEPQALTLVHKDLVKSLENEAFFSHILTINIDGKKEQALIKDLQRHPFKQRVLHADFQRITGKEKLIRNVTLHFLNAESAAGVKKGGVVTHTMKDIEITCTPQTLPEYIEIELADLDLDQVIHLSALKLPKGVELATPVDADHDLPVVSIHMPRVVTEEEPAEEDAANEEEKPAEDSKD